MIPFHPFADAFPLIRGDEFEALVADMRANGFRSGEEIVLLDGMILDGRNRYRAAIAAGLFDEDADPRTRFEFCQWSSEGGDGLFTEQEIAAGPLAYVIAKNIHRRHMDESQRAMVAARLANLGHGGARRSGAETEEFQGANLPLENGVEKTRERPVDAVSVVDAADMLNVSPRLVKSARAVEARGTDELRSAVVNGHLAVSAAAQAVALPADEQREVAKLAEAGKANVVRTVVKKGRRAAREAELGARILSLPEKKYGLIYADPEWRFEPRSRDTGMDRAPDNHYPTSDTLDIIARPVATIAAETCVLALWATAPMLPQAIAVMRGWGFEYKTHCVWKKVRAGAGRGAGYWFTGEHELLLIGTRGPAVAPAIAICGSVIDAPIGEHSEKPDVFAKTLEDLYPSIPKIELNARRARAGWDVWGLDAPVEHAEDKAVAPEEFEAGSDIGSSVVETAPMPRVDIDLSSLDIPDFLKRAPKTGAAA